METAETNFDELRIRQVYSWQSGWKPKAYTSFVPYLKVFKDGLYLITFEKMACLQHVRVSEKLKQLSGNFPKGGGEGNWAAFRPGEGGIWAKIFQKIKMPGGLPGGGMWKLQFDWYIIIEIESH